MDLYLHNTLTRTLEKFEPLQGRDSPVKLYCCGPTVYNFAHIGNLRTYIFEDLLRRTLEYGGYSVHHVMNITDVGHLTGDAEEGKDKVLKAAQEKGWSVWEISRFYEKAFFEDARKLNLIPPHHTPRATEHVALMIEDIEKLLDKGLAYHAGGNVYFEVSKFPSYYALSGQEPLGEAHHRVSVDSHKRDARDFALWFTDSKFKDQAMQWDSPWGKGYMGWHIECSAMARELLGEEIDLHCGGVDHIRVHHTNERAQAEGITGTPWVKIWLHAEFLVMEQEKMSKSLGNFLTLSDLESQGFHPLDYRYLCLGAHYRKQLSFNWEILAAARTAREKLSRQYGALGQERILLDSPAMASYEEKFLEAIGRDLGIAGALALVWTLLKDTSLSAPEKRTLLGRWDAVLGLDLENFSLSLREKESSSLPSDYLALLEERSQAKAHKNFRRADEIRDFFQKKGYRLIDSPEGTKCVREGEGEW